MIRLDGSPARELASETAGQIALLRLPSGEEDPVARNRFAIREHDRGYVSAGMLDARDATFVQDDILRGELFTLGAVQARRSIAAERDTLTPCPQRQRQAGAAGPVTDHRKGPFAVLPAIAVRAVMDRSPVTLIKAGHLRQLVLNSGCQQDRMSADRLRVLDRHVETVVEMRDTGHQRFSKFDAVWLQFVAADAQQLEGRRAVAGQVAMQRFRCGISRTPGVADQNAPAASSQDKGRAQSGGPGADNYDVVHRARGLQELGLTGRQAVGLFQQQMDVEDFDFELPDELIAQEPPPQRGGSRLLVVDRSTDQLRDANFDALPQYLRPGDLLVLNNTRVFPARLLGRRTPSGGAVEVLLLKPAVNSQLPTLNSQSAEGWDLEVGSSQEWDALVHPGQKLKPGARLLFEGGGMTLHGEVLGRHFHGRRTVRLWRDDEGAVSDAIDRLGHIPLPPYIKRADVGSDRERYQTVYARYRGSVAAPTAGLHFTAPLLEQLAARGVEQTEITLHVGYGTFKPVRVDRVEDHVVDPEVFTVSADAAGALTRALQENRRVVAVGTTTTRALESLTVDADRRVHPCSGTTQLFIHPGHRFAIVGGLVTNFHLPRSSLLMLVAAFAGRDRVLAAYRHAVEARYRFYSYGDAMLVL